MIFEVLTRNFFTIKKKIKKSVFVLFIGVCANVDPTLRNRAHLGAIAKVNPTGVLLKGFALGKFGVNFNKYKFFLFRGELTEDPWFFRI